MTAPRQILAGTTYLVTRRCAERQLLLRPSAATTAAFRYALALAARATGVLVHAVCVMSSHYHAVVTDPGARIPEFTRRLHSLVARAVNPTLGRRDSLWSSSEGCSLIPLTSPAVALEKIAYVLANPVAAGLVRDARDWPGLWSAPEAIGGPPTSVPRPDAFFRPDGLLPATIELELVLPPGFASVEEFQARLVEALARREAEAQQERRGAGFLGPARVLRQSPTSRPAAKERRFERRPLVAGADPDERRAALERIHEFVARYREAWSAFRAGVRDVVFPAGTYAMRVVHGVRCGAPA